MLQTYKNTNFTLSFVNLNNFKIILFQFVCPPSIRGTDLVLKQSARNFSSDLFRAITSRNNVFVTHTTHK